MSSGAMVPLGLTLGLWDRLTSWEETLEIARLADELGYTCLVVPESFGRDAVTLCDRLLAATKTIKVCFGVANTFSRSPAVLASTAATLDELSGGRFVLGVGGSTASLVENWHGLEFRSPVARTKEAVKLCRRIWARDGSAFDGDFFKSGGVKLGFQPLRENIPVWQGAVLERGLQACGEVADGWMPGNLPKEAIPWGREVIVQSAESAERDSSEIGVFPTFQLEIGDDVQQILPKLKFGIAMYFGPPESPYAKAAAKLGYDEDVRLIQSAYGIGGAKAAAAVVSDQLAASTSIIGSLDDCRNQIGDLLDAGADLVIVTMPAPTREASEPLLEGIIPKH